jgi:hypothetical protein
MIYRRDNSGHAAMRSNQARGSDMAVRNVFKGDEESAGRSVSSAFVVLPISLASGNFCASPVGAQQALYLLAVEQAAIVVGAIHRRRQLLLARGVHLWN